MRTSVMARGPWRRLAVTAAVVCVALSSAACGGGSDPGASSVNYASLSVDQLYQKAKSEGEVVLYSALSDDDIATLQAGFSKQYPGIKVTHFQEQGEQSASKLTEEYKAGVYKADVLDTDQNTIYAVGQEGLLAKYDAPVATNVDKSLKQTYFTGYRIQVKPIAYNTKLVSPADAPKDYQDLLDPKWNGKLCQEATDVSVFADRIQQVGQAAGTQYWKTLHSHGLRFISGQTNLVQAIEAGDCPIAVAANVHTVAKDASKGAPIAWVKTEPMYANYDAVGVAVKAPHPYAARLWVNYLLSQEGQQAIADAWRVPANPDVAPKEPELKDRDFKLILAGDDVMKNFSKYNTLWYTSTGRPVVGG